LHQFAEVGVGEILQMGERFEVFFDFREARIGGTGSEVPWNIGGGVGRGVGSVVGGFFRDEHGGGSVNDLCELRMHS
jgi:hypothetical protein